MSEDADPAWTNNDNVISKKFNMYPVTSGTMDAVVRNAAAIVHMVCACVGRLHTTLCI